MRTDTPKTLEYMLVNYEAFPGVRPRVNARYERVLGEHVWYLCDSTKTHQAAEDAALASLPHRVTICGSDHTPVRTAKIHTAFREKLLRRMLDAQKVLSNMVLFHCKTCIERFPTWHPQHRPEFELDVQELRRRGARMVRHAW